MKKRFLAWALVLCMLAALFPASAFAEGEIANDSVAPVEDDAIENIVIDPALENAFDEAAESIIASGYCGAVAWTIYDNGLMIISGTGNMADCANSKPWNDYLDRIRLIEVESGVTSIGMYAFERCESLTSVILPEGLSLIDGGAFYGCSGLTSLTLPEGTSIGPEAFGDCTGLTSLSVPGSVTILNDGPNAGCFYGCSGLKTAGPIVGGYDYEYGWTDEIPVYAFTGCSGLTSVILPENLTCINNTAFSNCSSLTSITIPESVTSIGYSAFYDCSSLTSITLPEGLTGIGESAFKTAMH